MRDSNGFTAVRALILMKAQVLSTAVKYFINIPGDGVTDKMRMFFIKMLLVVIMLQDMFNSNIAGN